MSMILRGATAADEDALWDLHAVVTGMEHADDALRTHPVLSRYVFDWGKRPGDNGFVAEDPESRAIVGAAWCRVFSRDERGYGYVNRQTPELTFAVHKDYRRNGLGTLLIERLLERMKGRHDAISLAVEPQNPALQISERFGFHIVREVTNWKGEPSSVMVRRLH